MTNNETVGVGGRILTDLFKRYKGMEVELFPAGRGLDQDTQEDSLSKEF